MAPPPPTRSHAHTPPPVTPLLRSYQAVEAEKAAAGAGGAAGLMSAPASAEDKLMHPGEEKLLVAYVHLLA